MILIVLILILIVLIAPNVHTVSYIFFVKKIPVSASEPRCSIISVHFMCLLIDFHFCTCVL